MEKLVVFVQLGVSFPVAWLAIRLLMPRLRQAGITGRDLHKPGQPLVPEMGGFGIVGGFSAAVVFSVGLGSFIGPIQAVDNVNLLAALGTVLAVSLIGIADDLLGVSQSMKALLPMLASLPLMAVKAGTTIMQLPLFGTVDIGLFYPLLLVPLGVTGAANAVNMLAGFNGLEVGMGIAAATSLTIVAYTNQAFTSVVLLLSLLGALLAMLYFNWPPAKVLVGDVGTLTIGAVIAAAAILGNFENAALIIIVPYLLDFLFKACNGFPTEGWWGEYQGSDGKLHCPAGRPVGLCQWIMKLTGGIREVNLVLVLVGFETAMGVVSVVLYAKIW
jgi:UDP-N-acetylglucosamine--dolichyl-phosphate N-acetylglucosaminephosphotransferase